MHESVMAWLSETLDSHQLHSLPALEVGSYNVNGGARSLFCSTYLGVDIVEGPGVDIVYDGRELPFVRERFPVVVSTEMLEHCERPWLAVAEMARVLQEDGHLLLTCRGFHEQGSFTYHNPPDRWRLGPGVLEMLATDAGLSVVQCVTDPQVPGWFIHAVKQPPQRRGATLQP